MSLTVNQVNHHDISSLLFSSFPSLLKAFPILVPWILSSRSTPYGDFLQFMLQIINPRTNIRTPATGLEVSSLNKLHTMDELEEFCTDLELVMPNGVVHSPVRIRSVTKNDIPKIANFLLAAISDGYYVSETGIMHFYGLAGTSWSWEGMGASDHEDFRRL